MISNLRNFIFVILILLTLFSGCYRVKSDAVNNLTDKEIDASNTNRPAENEISNLMKELETFNIEKRNEIASQIVEKANSDPEKRTQTVSSLTSEIKEICSQGSIIYSPMLFKKVRAMSDMLADLQATESLDVLIDCSNTTPPAVTSSISNFATVAGIIKFKEKAIPELKKKINESFEDPFIKCQIASTLIEIDRKAAENIIKEAWKNETNSEIQACLHSMLHYLEVTKKSK